MASRPAAVPSQEPAFAKTALSAPLFLGDIKAAERKLNQAGGLLHEYWHEHQARCLQDAEYRKENLFLHALLAGGAEREEAKDLLRDYWRHLAASDTAGDFQFHTWCRCGSVLRRAVYVDWFAAQGAWTPDELEEAAASFLGYGFKHAFPVLTGRGRSSNNQALSMALYLAVTGFLFGHKLTAHPTGKFLFDYGFGRLPDLIGLFAGDGYGGEGSTYTSHVNTSLTFWTAEFMAQVTGQDWLDKPFKPNGTTLRRMLELEMCIMSPNGLLAPWDHYGWQREINASPFAYMAKVNDDRRYLSLIPALDLWSDPGMLAWGRDDQLWTLVWWPEKFKAHASRELPAELFGWFLPKTGAALDDCAHHSRLMQVWDHATGSIAAVGRCQVNPNHVMFEYAGEPVFQDGIPEADKDPFEFPADQVFAAMPEGARERFLLYLGSIGGTGKADLKPVIKGIAPGLIGAANAIVLDDEGWFWPGAARVGLPRFYARSNELQAVCADCANFYNPPYDVQRARRSSVWTRDGFGLIVDELKATDEHLWVWQVYLRQNTTLEGRTARVHLNNGHEVLLAWAPGVEDVKLVPMDGYPRALIEGMGGSVRLELRARDKDALFAVVIAPDAQSASVRRLDARRFQVKIDGREHILVAGNLEKKKLDLGDGTTAAAFAWLPAGADKAVELRDGVVSRARADILDVSDIAEERSLGYKALAALTQWTAARCSAGASRLSQLDAILAEAVAPQPDLASLLAGLASPHWPVQLAAAEVIGRRGLTQAAAPLRALLEREHTIPKEELYPPENATGASVEALAKRWRLKAELVRALGLLRDREAVPLLGRILADSRDFYIVYSNIAQALGRIGGDAALDALEPAFDESEVNTHTRAEFARAAIEAAG